jgi:hypothetical protein
MNIPDDVTQLYRQKCSLKEIFNRLPRYGRRNLRNWYRALSQGSVLKIADYRTIASQCAMTVIETPPINKSGQEVRTEAFGEYALRNRVYH